MNTMCVMCNKCVRRLILPHLLQKQFHWPKVFSTQGAFHHGFSVRLVLVISPYFHAGDVNVVATSISKDKNNNKKKLKGLQITAHSWSRSILPLHELTTLLH